jgi:hypothetical protein
MLERDAELSALAHVGWLVDVLVPGAGQGTVTALTPVGNPMRAFADQAGVRCRSADPLPELAGFDCGEGRRLSAAEVGENLSMQLEGFPQAKGRLLAGLGPDASAADGIEAFVAGAGLAPDPARRARQALRALVEGESADLAERQSLRWMWNEMEYDGHYFGDAPEGGTTAWRKRWRPALTCAWASRWPRSPVRPAVCGCAALTVPPRTARTSW